MYIVLSSTGATVISCSIMAELSRSFLTLAKDETCLLCKSCFKQGDTVNHFTQKGWPTLINNAYKWKDINLPTDHEYYLFTSVYETLNAVEKAFGKCHEKCRITLSTKSAQYRKRFSALHFDEKKPPVTEREKIDEDEKPKVPLNTRLFNPVATGICFICNEERDCNQSPYNAGGLTKLTQGHKDIRVHEEPLTPISPCSVSILYSKCSSQISPVLLYTVSANKFIYE